MKEIKLEKKEDKGVETFYQYRIGDYKFWFTQNNKTGDIFTVSNSCDNKMYEDFDLSIVAHEENDRWYPNKFAFRGVSSRMTTAEAAVYAQKMTEVCAVLDAIQNFFETSFHASIGL